MAKNVTASFEIRSRVSEAIALGGGPGNAGVDVNQVDRFANGTGADAGNEWWSRILSVTAGAAVTHTLSALVDDAGRSCPFAKVRGFAAYNRGGGALKLGGATTHAWLGFLGTATDTITVQSSGSFAITAPEVAGMAVGAGSADQLKIDAVSGTVDYQIVIFGED